MAECFGAVGYSAASHDDLRHALDTIQHHMGTGPYLLNVEICPTSQRRAQVSSYSDWTSDLYYSIIFTGIFMVNKIQSITDYYININ